MRSRRYMKTKFKQFKLYAPTRIKTKAYELNEDGTLTISGVASTTNEDLDGEIVSPSAIQSLQKQAVGLNLHLDHNHEYDGGIGAITEAVVENNELIITAVVLSEYAKGIKERLDLGMNFGFSIGGIPVVNNINPQIIEDFILLEISLTLLPANWDTFGTIESKGVVKSNCLTGACHYILKNSSDIMRKEVGSENNVFTEEEVKEITDIVNEGFANKEAVIVDEFRDEIRPLVQEMINEEITGQVQQIVISYLDELFPEDEVEYLEAEVDEEVISESAVEDETVDETTTEEVEEKAETDVVEEELPVEEKAEEVPEDDEVFDEPLEINVEKELPIPEEGADYVPEDVVGDDVPTTVVEAKPNEVVIDEKSINMIVDRVFKKLNASRNASKKRKSKYALYKNAKKTKKENKFLDSEKRDKFGRNKKYL